MAGTSFLTFSDGILPNLLSCVTRSPFLNLTDNSMDDKEKSCQSCQSCRFAKRKLLTIHERETNNVYNDCGAGRD